jgi:FkbM family methyltransferase
VIEPDAPGEKNNPERLVGTYRESVDMVVAVTSHAKRASAAAVASTEKVAHNSAPNAGRTAPSRGRKPKGRKRIARALLSPAYKLTRPLMRSVVWRLRHHLLAPLEEEVRHQHDDDIAWQARVWQQQLDLRQHQSLLREEFQAGMAATRQLADDQHAIQTELHALQDIRAALADDLSTLRDVQAALATDLRAMQELRDEVQRLHTPLAAIEKYSSITARRVAVNCGPDEVLVRTEVGYVMCSTTDPAVIAFLMEAGEMEPGVRVLISRLLGPGDVFIDVGANLGLHTLGAARAMQGEGRVVAFEPYEPTFNLLSKTLFINGFAGVVEAHCAAVSDHSGSQPLFLGKTSGHHSLFPLDGLPSSTGDAVATPLVTLDTALATGTPPSLIKIDVEGAELDVINGARETLARSPDVGLIVEFGPPHLARTGRSVAEWFTTFRALGLDYQAIEPMTGALERWTNERLARVESVNLFFARPGAPIWEKALAG